MIFTLSCASLSLQNPNLHGSGPLFFRLRATRPGSPPRRRRTAGRNRGPRRCGWPGGESRIRAAYGPAALRRSRPTPRAKIRCGCGFRAPGGCGGCGTLSGVRPGGVYHRTGYPGERRFLVRLTGGRESVDLHPNTGNLSSATCTKPCFAADFFRWNVQIP